MIFVTYGTQPHDFKFLSQLVNQIDLDFDVVVQIGESKDIIDREGTEVVNFTDKFSDFIQSAEIVITHGGVGSIMAALNAGKKVIAIPRLADFDEHVDNHQSEVVSKLAKNQYIYELKRDEDINQVLQKVLACDFKKYQSNTENFINNLEEILRRERK